MKKPPKGWNSWAPSGGVVVRVEPKPNRPRYGRVGGHACEWHEYTASDDFDDCWA